MAGLSRQIQLRHILVYKNEVADLLKETIDSVKSESGRIKMLMSLAEKYSLCPTKSDGGNLGWLEIAMKPEDPRNPRGGYKPLDNEELNAIVGDAVRRESGTGIIHKGKTFGPVQTEDGFHVLMLSNEFTTDRIL